MHGESTGEKILITVPWQTVGGHAVGAGHAPNSHGWCSGLWKCGKSRGSWMELPTQSQGGGLNIKFSD